MKYSFFILLFLISNLAAMDKTATGDAEKLFIQKLNAFEQKKDNSYLDGGKATVDLINSFNVLKSSDHYNENLIKRCSLENQEKKIIQLINDRAREEGYYESDITALHGAALYDNLSAISFILLKTDVKPSSCKYSVLTQVRSKEIAKLLLEHGEDINKLNKVSLNVLQSNVYSLSIELLEYFLSVGVDVNYANEVGTALHWLACTHWIQEKSKTTQKAQLLINAGVQINMISNKRKTVLDLCFDRIEFLQDHPEYQKPYQELAAFLRKRGAKTAEELENVIDCY